MVPGFFFAYQGFLRPVDAEIHEKLWKNILHTNLHTGVYGEILHTNLHTEEVLYLAYGGGLVLLGKVGVNFVDGL